MSIYSANRSGSMEMSQIVANEAYTDNDLGRIMYESQVNDMAFFEAILAADFRELEGLREGTLLESEIRSLNEASFKDLIEKLKERLKEFWTKIKAAFKSAMTKIAAYVLHDGKAFVKNFKEVYKKYGNKWGGKVEGVKYYTMDRFVKIPTVDKVYDIVTSSKDYKDGFNKNQVVEQALAECLGLNSIKSSEFVKLALEKSVIELDVKQENIDGLTEIVENGSKTIKKLKESETTTNNQLKKLSDRLQEAERLIAKDNNVSVNNIVVLCSAYETVVSQTTKASIAITKASVKSARSALSAIMSDLRKNGTVLHNSAVIDAADEVDDALFSDAPTGEMDSDTKEAIDDLVGED